MIPAAFVTKEFVLGIQSLCCTKIFKATSDRTILFNIKTEVEKGFISCCNSFTPQASCFIRQYTLIQISDNSEVDYAIADLKGCSKHKRGKKNYKDLSHRL